MKQLRCRNLKNRFVHSGERAFVPSTRSSPPHFQ
uniref:Ycf15 n=1 Tax=Parascaris univalens TaxID=6257 RepID=A0A915BI70_PARUN